MANVIINEGSLAANGVIWSGNVGMTDGVTLIVLDSGNGSEVVAEVSDDNSTWSELGRASRGGRFFFPASTSYMRFRVENFVSGLVRVEVDTVGSAPAGTTTQGTVNSSAGPRPGSVYAATWPGVTLGPLADNAERAANYYALQECFDYAAANTLEVWLGAGRYEIYGGRVQAGLNLGLQAKNTVAGVHGVSAWHTNVRQYHPDHAVMTLGETGNVKTYEGQYSNFSVVMGVMGTANSRGFWIGSHFKSRFQNIGVGKSGSFTPARGVEHIANCDFFSNVVETLSVNAGQENLYRLTVNGTGSVWNNTYLGGGTTPPSESSNTNLNVLSGPALYIANSFQGIWNQLNIEWCVCTGNPMHIQNTPGMVFNSVHFEKNKLIGAGAAFIRVFGGVTNPVFSGLELFNNNIKVAYATGTDAYVFSLGGSPQVVLNGFEIRQETGSVYGGVDRSLTLLKADGDTAAGGFEQFTATNIVVGGLNRAAGFHLDASLPSATYGAINSVAEYTYCKGRSRTRGATIIVSNVDFTLWGVHYNPVILHQAAITVARKVIVKDKFAASGFGSGAPAPLASIVWVHRNASATGAFNVDITANDGTTIVASCASANTENKVLTNGTTPLAT